MDAILDDLELYHLEQSDRLYGFPEYVKQADYRDLSQGPDDLPSASFADSRRRKYPCHTKAACWYSYLQLLKAAQSGKISETEHAQLSERVQTAANYLGIGTELQELQTKHASIYHEEDVPDSQFMYVYVGEGTKQRRYPLTSPDQIKQAAAYLLHWRDHFPAADRRLMADRLLRQAEKLAAVNELTERQLVGVERLAGEGFYDVPEAAEMVRNRVKSARHCPSEVAETMEAMARTVETNPMLAMDPPTLWKFAETIDDFDRAYGVAGQYGPLLPRAEDVLFKHSYRQVDEALADACETATGAMYRPNQFAKLSLADVRSVFGTEFANEVSNGFEVDGVKLAFVANSLPRHEARLLDSLMQTSGEAPFLRKHSSLGPTRLTQQDWDNLTVAAFEVPRNL